MVARNKLIHHTLEFAKEDRRLSWYYLLSTLALTALAFSLTYFATFVAFRVSSGILAGLLTARLLVIYHDFEHEAILNKSFSASLIMKTIGLLTLTPPSIWEESHEHHHHTNSRFSTFVLGSFPTISTDTYQRLRPAARLKYLLIRHPLMILFAYIPIFLVSFCLWPFCENPRKYWDCGLSVTIHILIACILWITGGWMSLLCTLIVPSLVTFSIGGYIFYAQHNFPEVILNDDDSWDYFDAALRSSSYIRMNRVMRWFTANIGYHHIHHVNARIPFYKLPAAMAKVTEFQHPRTTSLAPGEMWRCLQLKLWDSRRGRMITMNEYHEGH